MEVKKFLGHPEMEMVALLMPKSNEIFIHIYDQFDHNICTNIKIDYKTAIEFRNELNRMFDKVEEDQLLKATNL